MNIKTLFEVTKKYYNIGGLKLVFKGIYGYPSLRLSNFCSRYRSKSEICFTICLNDCDYTVCASRRRQWNANIPMYWRHFELNIVMPEVTRALSELLSPGDCFIDVGGWIGDTTLYAHSIIGDNGSIYAFEPDPDSVKQFQRNVQKNNIPNITIFPYALGDKTEEFRDFKQITLDHFLEQYDIKPNLIKIDVEGFEFEVLKGGSRHVLGKIPIILEVHDKSLLDKRKELINLIFERANVIYLASAQGVVPSEYPYETKLSKSDILSDDRVANILLLPKQGSCVFG